MKAFIKPFLVIFLLIFSSISLNAQKICSDLFESLEKKGLHPQAQVLTAAGTNNLPYNIIVNFWPKDTKSEHNLVLLFDLEEAYTYKDHIFPIFEDLKNQSYNSSTKNIHPKNRNKRDS